MKTSTFHQLYASAIGENPKLLRFLNSKCCLIFSVNLNALSNAFHIGWMNVNYIELQSSNTIFPAGPVSYKEMSTLMTIFVVGCLFGNISGLFIENKYGRKNPLMFIGFMNSVSTFNRIYEAISYVHFICLMICIDWMVDNHLFSEYLLVVYSKNVTWFCCWLWSHLRFCVYSRNLFYRVLNCNLHLV